MKKSILLVNLVLVLTNAFGNHENFVDKSKQDNCSLKMSTFAPVIKQIEQITEIKPKSAPPSEESALQRIAEIFEIPVEILTFKEGRVHVIDMNLIKTDLTEINDQLRALYNSGDYCKWLIERNVGSLKSRYNDQLQRFLPVYSDYISPEQIKAASIQITANVCNKWDSKTKKFDSDAGKYQFDTSSAAQQRRQEIAQKPWDEE